MYNELKLGLMFLVCSSFAVGLAQESQVLPVSPVDVLLEGLRQVIEVGKVYVENAERLDDKQELYRCADEYISKFLSGTPDKKILSDYYACLKPVSESEYGEKNTQLAEFVPYLIPFEDEEAWKNFAWYQTVANLNKVPVVKLPHPAALLKKAAEDIGKFAFVNKVEEVGYSPQARFVVTLQDALLLLLNRQKHGELAFEAKLKAKLTVLAELCAKYTIFKAKKLSEVEKNEKTENEYSSKVLIDLGEKIAAILASAGGRQILPYEDKVALGVAVASVLHSTYTSYLKEAAEGRQYVVSGNQLVKLGDEEIKSIEKTKAPDKLEDDYDAKSYAMGAIVHQIKVLKDTKAAKSVRMAEFQEINPLEDAFKV